MSYSSSSALAREFHLGMADPEVSCQGIVPTERLLLRAQMTSNLLLARIVNGVLVTSEIVRPREDGVTWFARAGIDALTLVWPGL